MTTDFGDYRGQPIRRYWVEATHQYYPSGGISDIKGQHISRVAADAHALSLKGEYDYVEVHDIMNMLLEEYPDPDYS